MATFFCENCGHEVKKPLPVEPVYDLELAAFLIPCKLTTLYRYLNQHGARFPKRYRRQRGFVKIRVLTASEIQRLRKHFIVDAKRGEASKLTTVTEFNAARHLADGPGQRQGDGP